MRRNKWEYGVILDFKHLSKDYYKGSDGEPHSMGVLTTDFADEVYNLDHPWLLTFDHAYKAIDGKNYIAFNGGMNIDTPEETNEEYLIPDDVFNEVVDVLD